MRHYEVVFIFNPALDEAAVTQKLERYHGLVTGGETGGEVVAVDHWGARQLAYPIGKQKSGYYVVSQFNARAEYLTEFERILTLDDDLLRYLIVLNEGEPASGMSVLAEVPEAAARPSDDEDDEDEDEDEDEDRGSNPPEFSGGRGRRRRMEGPPIEILNYKDVATLSRFITEQGKLLPRRTTKVTAPFQRQLGRAIKRARFLALLPYVRTHE